MEENQSKRSFSQSCEIPGSKPENFDINSEGSRKKKYREFHHPPVLLFIPVFIGLFYSCRKNIEVENCGPTGGVTIEDQGSKHYNRWLTYCGGIYDEEFENIIQVTSGNLLAVGASVSYSCSEYGDAAAVMMDKSGNVIWAKTYGGEDDDMLIDLAPTPDGGFVAVGWTNSFGAKGTDVWVVKLKANGSVEWQKLFGGSKDEQATSVDVSQDGKIVVGGGTTSFGAGGSDIWLLLLSKDGNIIWQNTYGGNGDDAPQSDYGEFSAGVFFDNEGYIVAGASTTSFGQGDGDVLILKLDPIDGSVLWQKSYGGISLEGTWTVKPFNDGDYLLPGILEDPDIDYEESCWIVKINHMDGSIVWQEKFGMKGVSSEPLGASPTADGGILLAGYYEKGANNWYSTLVRLNGNGNILWAKQLKKGSLDYLNDAIELTDGTIAGVGIYYSPDRDGELMTFRFDENGEPGSSCSVVSNLGYSPKNTNINPTDTQIIVTPTNTTETNTAAIPNTIQMVPLYECHN